MKRKDYFSALYDLARVINASLEPEVVLDKIVKRVSQAMGVKACSLRLLDADGKKLLWAAACGLSKGYVRKGAVVVAQSGLDQRALKGRTVYVKDARTSKLFQYGAAARSEKIKSVLVVPLMVEKKAIGVLRVYTGTIREFHEDEIKFLEAAANLSAIALENARLHQALKTDFDLLVAHKYRLDDN
jgi:signal transduction protein with GAF and PtsI domain